MPESDLVSVSTAWGTGGFFPKPAWEIDVQVRGDAILAATDAKPANLRLP